MPPKHLAFALKTVLVSKRTEFHRWDPCPATARTASAINQAGPLFFIKQTGHFEGDRQPTDRHAGRLKPPVSSRSAAGLRRSQREASWRGQTGGDGRTLPRQLSWPVNGWRAAAILAETVQASPVERIPTNSTCLGPCGATVPARTWEPQRTRMPAEAS